MLHGRRHPENVSAVSNPPAARVGEAAAAVAVPAHGEAKRQNPPVIGAPRWPFPFPGFGAGRPDPARPSSESERAEPGVVGRAVIAGGVSPAPARAVRAASEDRDRKAKIEAKRKLAAQERRENHGEFLPVVVPEWILACEEAGVGIAVIIDSRSFASE